MRKCISVISILLFFAFSVFAQQRTITGKVLDEKETPIANASVVIKGTNRGTTTNETGQFTLSVEANDTALEVSNVNYVTLSVDISSNTSPVIHMKANPNSLNEVVVVAYGTQKRSEITSAISTVGADAIKAQQVTTVGQALQGTAPGVIVVNTNGQPGENPTIRIRGVASILASADPLIVVDGVVFNGNLNMINPADIDNFSVLKDAPATALYGSRAANGVILITTKAGRRNAAPSITVSSVVGISKKAVGDYSYINTQQHMELGWEGLKNVYADAGLPDAAQRATRNLIRVGFRYNPYGPSYPNPVDTSGKLVAGAVPLWSDNWTDALERNSPLRRDFNLGISGGTEKSKYYFSAGYLNQDSYITESNYERISTLLNYTTYLRDWLQLGAKASIVSSKQNYPNQGSGEYADVIQYERTMSSVFPIYARNDSGQLIRDIYGNPVYDFGKPVPGRTVNANRPVLQPSNVVATIHLDEWDFKRLLTDLNAYAQVNFTKDLYFRSNFGINRNFEDQLNYQNRDYGDAESVQGRVYRQQDLTTSWTWNNMINYEHRFGDNHIEAMASYEAYKYFYETLYGSKTGFPFPGQNQPSNAAVIEDFQGYTVTSTLLSYLARAKYDYQRKYFAEFTIRRDGSTIFAPDYRFGWFPAGGVSWLASEEKFLKASNTINFFKVRASYGALGNNALTNYFPYLTLYSEGSNYNELTNGGVYLSTLANAGIQWEKQLTSNIGIDFGLFKNKLSGSIDLFEKNSKNLLFNQPLPPSIGFPIFQTNIGKLQNKGIELNLDYRVIHSKDLTLNLMFNITYVKNTIKELLPGLDTAASSGAFRRVVGKSLYEYYLPVWAGVDPQTGGGQWWVNETDANGNLTGKKVKSNSYTEALNSEEWVGSGLPKFTGGFTTRVGYKGFDLNILFNYAFGGKYYDNNYSYLMHGLYSGFGAQMSVDELRRWQKPGDITDVPRLNPSSNDEEQLSTRFLYNGDYVRLRNVTLGYTFNPDKSQKIFKNIRVYIQGDNLLTWDKLKKGSDPESAINGYAGSNAVVFKIISAGVDLNF
jgi:TonB-linked SusC/RagA family outer membrane protein